MYFLQSIESINIKKYLHLYSFNVTIDNDYNNLLIINVVFLSYLKNMNAQT